MIIYHTITYPISYEDQLRKGNGIIKEHAETYFAMNFFLFFYFLH
jgi:hypothetical protein